MTTNNEDPKTKYPQPPYPGGEQQTPGKLADMDPAPDHGEESYKGNGRLTGKRAVITGGDSGIGRAVAIAFAREGADVLIAYLNEHEDAQDTAKWIEQAGRKAVLVSGDIQDENHCKTIIQQAVDELGGLDILVNNAAFQMSHTSLQEISAEEWDKTFRTNIHAMFYLCRAAEEHLTKGGAVINTTSVNAYNPKPTLVPYASTKGAIQNFTASLAQLWAEKGIRVNCVAPGPVWTPLIPSTMPPEEVEKFGESTPLKRAAQPAELAAPYVLLASTEASFINGATIQVTGGTPTI